MRDSIFGFTQSKLLEMQTEDLKLDVTDIFLMDYIQRALISPSMDKQLDEHGQPYVWLKHSKILEDLPILDIKERMLKRRINKLITLGLIDSFRISNGFVGGSKSYYTITKKFEELQYSNEPTKGTTIPQQKVLDDTSIDNKLIYNINSNSKELLLENPTDSSSNSFNQNTKSPSLIKTPNSSNKKKENKYTKCVNIIDEFTQDEVLRKSLIEYLNLRLEMKDKPIYTNQWKGLINKLKKFKEDDSNCDLDGIVRRSIEQGYASFYPLPDNKYQNNKTQRFYESGKSHVESITKEDMEKDNEFRKKLEQEGRKSVF